ncbi:MAG: GH32 C-terminal domain-containing protein [Lachnospiraceae bacterium]|nr:GH32 C-terminal domain-containing protein [Lachnospiraceae bacterium]
MKKKIIPVIVCLIVLCVIGAAGILFLKNRADANDKYLLLYLPFDEGKGLTISDASGHAPDTDLNYGLAHAVFTEDQDPQWREQGIKGGCLLLDGSTTYLTYNKNDISIQGDSLTISVWLAPRTFEWDDPNAAENGTDKLTGIVSQVNKEAKQGFILGYQRHGRLSFQVGTGTDWLTVWTNGDNLKKYEWNHISATFDAANGEMRLYLNGELAASRSVPAGSTIAPAKNRSLLVGRNGEGERLTAGFLNVASGYIDELKLYSCALSSEEIQKAYSTVTIPEINFSEIWLQNILTTDYTRTQYHGGPYQFWMNEPHAPFYFNGRYHLFFQQNMTGSYWRNIGWGHLVSEDMVNWTPVKEAIVPTEGSVVPDGVWSGGAALDVNGVPLLFFTAGNDDFTSYEGLISNQNIGVAYPADLTDPDLTDWIICDALAISQKNGQGRRGEFRDPHIWQENGIWYMLICSGSTSSSGGTALLYTTDTLELLFDGTVKQNWVYQGPIYQIPNQSRLYGQTWELPVILPVSNPSGTITKYMFVFSPAPASIADNKIYYFLGDFDHNTGTFTPEESFQNTPKLLDYGANVFTGPSAFIDPVSGDVVMFSIMQDQRSAADQGASGWAHTVGLARKLWLSEDGSDLKMTPVDALTSLEETVLLNETNLTLEEANNKLKNVQGDMLHIRLTANVSAASEFGIHLKKGGKWDCTTYTYEVKDELIHGSTENRGDGAPTNTVSGYLPNENGTLTMDIYVDRSLVEAFFNEYKSISIRAYTEEPDSQGIELFADGTVQIESLYVATMGSIFD